MKSNYKALGTYIREVNQRDTELNVSTLLGVSIQKKFIPSIANIIGTDMSTYKIVKKNQFAYGPVTSRNGDKISIALLEDYEKAVVSQAYTPFEVIDTNQLLPEYLMMWFRRSEFDRYARFMSHGSAREIFSWDEMCRTELPVPLINKQKEIVKGYKVLIDRIELSNKLIENLQETAQTIYKQWFVDYEFPDENGKLYISSGGELTESELGIIPKGWSISTLGKFCDVKGGKRLPKGEELNGDKSGNPYIRVADMSKSKFIVLNSGFQYVHSDLQKQISRYIVSDGDVIISIVGTIGSVNVIHESLDRANLTENCVKLTNFHDINSDFIYHYLSSSTGKQVIETKIVGGVQGKLPLYNIQSIPIICPPDYLLSKFKKLILSLNLSMKIKTSQVIELLALVDLLLAKLSKLET